MIQKFDVFIIGSGPAGVTAAFEFLEAGYKVGITDKREYGGTCPLRGCDPKKTLTGAAELMDAYSNLSDISITGNIEIDWKGLISYKREFTDPVSTRLEHHLSEYGGTCMHGEATFIDENRLQVGDNEIEADHILIATGAGPKKLPIAGFEHTVDSEYFLDMETLPDDIVFLGGGYIAFEFAHIAARAGADVTVLEAMDRPLQAFEQDIVNLLLRTHEEIGIAVYTGIPATRIEKDKNGFIVRAGENGGHSFYTDLVVNTVGRVPNTAGLNLEKGNIKADKGHIAVNNYMQSTTNPHVYVAGDSNANSLQLTPVAVKEAETAAHNIMNGNTLEADYTAIPTALYTLPPVASLGLTEAQAKEKGIDVHVNFQDTTNWYSSWRIAEKASGFKIIIDKKTDLLVGVHLLGNHSEELINLFALAMREKITRNRLKDMLFAYPTVGSNISSMLEM